jgi:hypothetical protein
MRVWTLGLLAALFFASAVAGPPIDFTPHGTQPGLLTGLQSSTSCSGCHGGFSEPDESFMPGNTWGASLMANATRDPLFWAALDVANRDVPGIGDWCLRCHTSQGWYGGRVRKTTTGGLIDGTNGCSLTGDHDNPDATNNDYGGVTCFYCHRMQPSGPAGQLAPPGSGNAWLNDDTSCNGGGGPCRFGPYHYDEGDPREPEHNWKFSRFTTSSAHCGTCHDVSSPIVSTGLPLKTLILGDGTDTGRPFPAERTYTEWRRSRYGDAMVVDSFEAEHVEGRPAVRVQDCQDCHMRKTESPDARACIQNPSGSRTGELAVHEFVGGNPWMLRIIKGLYGGPSQLDREAAFDRAIAWSEEMLQQRSADLALTLGTWSPGNPSLNASVRITNRAGHKLPTGYGEGRRMWIEVRAVDQNGATVFHSGAWDPATGELASDPQLKVYEVLQGIWDAGTSTCRITDAQGRKQFRFALNNCIAKDNRIPPEGFMPRTADDPIGLELRPVAYTYPETAPGSGVLVNHDVTDYAINVPPGVSSLTVTARLHFQVASKEYIEFLRNEAVENAIPSENQMCDRSWTVGPANKSRGQFMYDLWASPEYGRSPPVLMRSATVGTSP